jgi:hypothetical protein
MGFSLYVYRPYQAPPTVDLEKSRLTLGCAALGLRIVYHVKKMAVRQCDVFDTTYF